MPNGKSEKKKTSAAKPGSPTFEGFLDWMKNEKGFEIGMDESWKASLALNFKALFEEYLSQWTSERQKSSLLTAKQLGEGIGTSHYANTLANLALESAVTTMDLIGKAAAENFNLIGAQKLDAAKIGTDRSWNFDVEALQLLNSLGLGEVVKALKTVQSESKKTA